MRLLNRYDVDQAKSAWDQLSVLRAWLNRDDVEKKWVWSETVTAKFTAKIGDDSPVIILTRDQARALVLARIDEHEAWLAEHGFTS